MFHEPRRMVPWMVGFVWLSPCGVRTNRPARMIADRARGFTIRMRTSPEVGSRECIHPMLRFKVGAGPATSEKMIALEERLKELGRRLGFDRIGIAAAD